MSFRIFLSVFFATSLLIVAETAISADLEIALLSPDANQKAEAEHSCGEGLVSNNSCQPKIQMAAGSECPANSGDYCSDELPYCCGTPGNYCCAKDVNGC